MKHKFISYCMVAHWDENDELLPPCRKCSECGFWVEYDKLDGECHPGTLPERRQTPINTQYFG